ncbi:MAG: benzoyl-CoA reductase subunit A [Candidatus Tectomicrobia bacterium]|uniref:Benzoyl-CoA reductase subunit A n=1 Tax=Tectimicrobiota bacterium TaxID=2528274 RepID=A0A932CNJ9_UNCTE|nr:benzoyl-CoA reductase subunit A [Candidatus Tectomicrobia bacterium]
MSAYYLGIDLGSTTTKAVILRPGGKMVGRGIINTRSNYQVATEVARNEAEISARFTLLRERIAPGLSDTQGWERFQRALEQNFRFEQQWAKLGHLKEICLSEGDSPRFGAHRREILAALGEIFGPLEENAYPLFVGASSERSQFFRDIVGSQYLRLAEREAQQRRLDFEPLMGIYDKAILQVENRIFEESFSEEITRALERTLREQPDLSRKFEVRQAIAQVAQAPLKVINMVGTGYGRQQLPFRKDQIRSEILCHGLGAHAMFPGTRTVLDIGGQDTKAIQVDEEGIVTGFQMNDRCAAGCGRYLGYIADELNLGLHELGPLSLQASRTLRINSTCTVFAGAELRDRLNLGETRENILAGLHRAIVLRALSLLARSGGIANEFTFTGGVAKNLAVVQALQELTAEHYGPGITLNVHSDSIYTGALGAAIFAMENKNR